MDYRTLTPAGALASVLSLLSGLALILWALFARRSRGDPRCPKCQYLMIGATGLRCPECGHAVADQREFYRTRRRWRWVAVGAVIVVGTPWYVLSTCGWLHSSRAFVPHWQTVEERQIGPYVLERAEARSDWREVRVFIRRDDEIVLALKGHWLHVGTDAIGDDEPVVGLGEDITGDGIPNLILFEDRGGNACCRTYYVLSLDAVYGVEVLTVVRGCGGAAVFKDLTGDGRLECVLNDSTFMYWHTCHTCSPIPKVVLRYGRGTYVIAAELMAKPAPAEHELSELARQVREAPAGVPWTSDSVSVDYWAEMLNLIYSGHEELAWRFAEEAWPKARSGKDEFRAEFRERLAESPYWPAIRAVGIP